MDDVTRLREDLRENLRAGRRAIPGRARRVAVIGGGAAGTIAAAHLLQAADEHRPVDVRVLEQAAGVGPGLAYRTRHPLHLLNNYAGRLSALADDPDHLLRWCATQGYSAEPTTFLPRVTYGRYLGDVLEHLEVPAGSVLRRTRGTVSDVRRDPDGFRVQLSCGWSVEADAVVLALGNPPPRRQPAWECLGESYSPDPWDPGLTERVAGAREVLVVGTGLTMIDVVAQLHAAVPSARFTAISRHGLLPEVHRRTPPRVHDTFAPGPAALAEVAARISEQVEQRRRSGGDWRDVVDSVRARANDLWRGFTDDEQEEFVATLARQWEISRHRMAPEIADHLARLQSSGVLRIATPEEIDGEDFDHVVNCTGPAPVHTPGWNPLVDSLFARGTIRPHRLGLGLELDEHGRAVDREGRVDPDLYVAGAARRGLEWEVAAIPDLRMQAVRLAQLVLGDAAEPAGLPRRQTLPAG